MHGDLVLPVDAVAVGLGLLVGLDAHLLDLVGVRALLKLLHFALGLLALRLLHALLRGDGEVQGLHGGAQVADHLLDLLGPVLHADLHPAYLEVLLDVLRAVDEDP